MTLLIAVLGLLFQVENFSRRILSFCNWKKSPLQKATYKVCLARRCSLLTYFSIEKRKIFSMIFS